MAALAFAHAVPSDFVPVNFDAPVDVPGRIALIPKTAKMKGVFFSDLLERMRKQHLPLPNNKRYLPFSDYPMAEWADLVAQASVKLFPDVSFGQAVRRLGQRVYPTISRTLAGRVLFSGINGDFNSLLAVTSKAWQVAAPHSYINFTRLNDHSARVELRAHYCFPEFYHCGIFEGAATTFGLTGETRIRVLSPCDIDAIIGWRKA